MNENILFRRFLKLTSAGSVDVTFNGGIFSINGSGLETIEYIDDAFGGGYFLGGSTSSTDGHYTGEGVLSQNALLVKLTSTGTFDTSFGGNGIMTYGTTISSVEELRGMSGTTDGGAVMQILSTGTTSPFIALGSSDAFVVKVLSNGNYDISYNVTGIKRLGTSLTENSYQVIQTPYGYAATGGISAGDGDFAGQGYLGGQDIYLVHTLFDGTLRFY